MTRIRYTRLLVHLIIDNLAVGVEGGKDSSGLLPCSGGASVVYVCYRFGVRRFRSIQKFNGDDFAFRILVFRVTCTNIFLAVINNFVTSPIEER